MQAAVLIILYAIVIAAALTADAFAPVIPLQKPTSRRHLLPKMAAKKGKKTNQRNSQPRTASGKGFGQNKSPTTVTVDDSLQSAAKVETPCSSPIHADLLTWLKQNPNTFVSPKFSLQPSTLGGYGGFANAPIPKDELLFRIPRECCVTYEDALSDPDCGEAFRLIKEKRVPSWRMILIAGWIAKEYLVAKEYEEAITTEKDGIKHSAYFQSVPWDRGSLGQDHLLFWSDEEVETLLGGSLAYEDALLIRKTVDNAVMLLCGVMVPIVHGVRVGLRDQDLHSTDDDADYTDILERLQQAIRGAFVIALSRSFAEEVECDDESIEVENLLLPLIDILQHSNTPNTILEPYEDYVLVRARRDVESGEELFHQYQEENNDVIPPHKFFTRYGFIPGVKEPIAELLKGRSHLFFDSDDTNS